MKLIPLPKDMEEDYLPDALVYNSDTELYYGDKVDKSIIKDILDKTMQIYSAYYHFKKGWDTPRIYLLGRGSNSGKFKLTVQGFKPYCYRENKEGDYKTYLGIPVEKLTFKGMHPSKVKTYRQTCLKRRRGSPYESDILFHRRFLIDMYDYFKPDTPIQPKVAILDVETDYPVTDNIISYSINDSENPILYESKFDTKYPTELALNLYEILLNYDIVTGWNVEFDIGALCKIDRKQPEAVLDNIEKHLTYARNKYKYSKDKYIENILKNDILEEDETKNLLNILIKRNYLKEEDGIIKLGDREFNPKLSESITILDLLSISKKMYAREIRGRWSLDNVGKQLAGIDKVHLGAKHIRDLDEDSLLEYNVMDSIIPEIIDNILGGMEGHLILSWNLQVGVDDVTITAVVNDIALLRAYHKSGIVLPTRDFSIKDEDVKYKAAEPDARPGIYKGLIVTDLVHAYPWAVISKNISPETKDLNGDNLTPNGIRFNDGHSVFIDTLKDIMAERGKIKKKLNSIQRDTEEWKRLKSIDFALKTQAAAFSHGIFGWANSRMRDYEVADSITAIVRNLIDIIKDACDVAGCKWVYVHTDSAFVNGKKNYKEGILGYLNDILQDYCAGYLVMPELDFKGYHPTAYIHSPARNVLVPEDGSINNDDTWDVTGMNFMRSEVPPALADIEIDLIKSKMRGASAGSLKYKLKNMILDLPNIGTVNLALVKPLKKKIGDYGKTLLDGSHGNVPYHIKALLRAQEEYGFMVEVGDKFGLLPIITDETVGVKKIRRKRVDIAFDIDKGLPENYMIDYENYLNSNLFGKIHGLFDCTPKKLKEQILTPKVLEKLNGGI